MTEPTNHRPLNREVVAKLAYQLESRAWTTPSDAFTIELGDSLLLLDGQHRLAVAQHDLGKLSHEFQHTLALPTGSDRTRALVEILMRSMRGFNSSKSI